MTPWLVGLAVAVALLIYGFAFGFDAFPRAFRDIVAAIPVSAANTWRLAVKLVVTAVALALLIPVGLLYVLLAPFAMKGGRR